MDQPTAEHALHQLDALVGEWSIQAIGADGEPWPGGGTVVFEWMPSGAHLLQRTTIDLSEAPDSIAVIGCDAANGTYFQLYSDERGVCRVYQMDIGNGEWRLWRDGEPFSQRFAGRFGDAGNTITSLQTRAVRDGDDFVINGQKIWTSGAHNADWMFMLARTDPDAPKHRGITYFLMDMKSPGVTVRPLINLAGGHMFNEVFFEDVRVPSTNVLGEVNRGWYIGTTTLDFERSSIGNAVGQRQSLEYYMKFWKNNQGKAATGSASAKAKDEFADRWIEASVAKMLSYVVITIQGQGRVPNHEASIAKLFNTELSQRIARTAMKMTGTNGLLLGGEAPMRGRAPQSYMQTVSSTIAGGTSEVQRNIVATRGLGLPRA
jgi:alkylation response protein AidB-like acyl-CoA dehydrogenase